MPDILEHIHGPPVLIRTAGEPSIRIAGQIVPKFVNGQLGFAVLDDISPYTATTSTALRAFFRETNRAGTSGSCPISTSTAKRLTRANPAGVDPDTV